VSGKDIVLALLARWGAKQSQGMGVEFVDIGKQLPMPYRNTIANMMAEAEAQNGIFPADDITEAWFKERGIAMPYPRIVPGLDAHYEIDEELDLSAIAPMIAKPFSPGNAFAADEVAKERLTFDKAMIGSCTNGGYDDLLQAALVLRAARALGKTAVADGKEFIVFPGSGRVKDQIELPDPRLDGESIAAVLRAAGAQIRASWCGPCFGQGPDALKPGQRAITTFNRNWQNRMGVGGEGYLASPPVVAASALLGYMAPPSALGLEWGRGIRGLMGKGRLEAFSDGVLAIIITIMVLELRVPHGDTLATLKPLVPSFFAYVLSFVYIGIYWNNHHHMLHAANTVSGPILWANLHLLFWLSLLPAATGWVGENYLVPVPTAMYGIVLLMAGIAYWTLQQTILAAEGPDSVLARAVGRHDWKGRLSPVAYLVAIAASFVAPWLAQLLYAAVAMVWLVPDRRIERALRTA
jgi:uncharacterized membrane protein